MSRNIFLEAADDLLKKRQELEEDNYQLIYFCMYYECLYLVKAILYKESNSVRTVNSRIKSHDSAIVYLKHNKINNKNIWKDYEQLYSNLNKCRYLTHYKEGRYENLQEYYKELFENMTSRYEYTKSNLKEHLD